MTEKQIEKIKKKIRSYRALLSAEKRKFGGYDDSRGTRYVIAEFYIRIKDFKGAQRYYNWFAREFDQDVGFPDFNLFWAMTLYENKKITEAIRKVYKTVFSNTYLLDLICDKNPQSIDKSETWGAESLSYAKQIEDECKKIITPGFKNWVCEVIETDDFKNNMNRFISLQKLIKDENPGKQRNALLNASGTLEKELTGE